jgi:hypothetical protein
MSTNGWWLRRGQLYPQLRNVRSPSRSAAWCQNSHSDHGHRTAQFDPKPAFVAQREAITGAQYTSRHSAANYSYPAISRSIGDRYTGS